MNKEQERSTYICESAKSVKECVTNSEIAKFHAFNQKGLVAEKKKLDIKFKKAVAEKQCQPQIAELYGSGSNLYIRIICNLARQDVVGTFDLKNAIKGLSMSINSAYRMLLHISKDK